MSSVRVFGSELRLLFRRRRTGVMLIALAAVPILIAVAVRLTQSNRGPAFIAEISSNGFFVASSAITVAVPFFLPLTVAVVAGDSIAGEASAGTLRYLLVAPAGRIRLLLVKFASTVVFVLSATLVMAVAGTLIGLTLFPTGPVTLLSGDTIPFAEALTRTLLVALYVALSLLGLAAISLFISTLTDSPVAAIAATAGVAVVSQVLDQLPQIEWIHPWLFTDPWLGFSGLLSNPVSYDAFGQNALLQLGYVAVFGALAWARFTSKDIAS